MPLSKYCPNKKASKQRSQGSEAPYLQRHFQSKSKEVMAEHHQPAQPNAPPGSCQVSSGTFQQLLLWLICTGGELHTPRRVPGGRNDHPTNQKAQTITPLSWRWHSELDFLSSDSLAAVWHREHSPSQSPEKKQKPQIINWPQGFSPPTQCSLALILFNSSVSISC